MSTLMESRWRSALKSLSWRVCASGLTALLVFGFTGRLSLAVTLGGIEGALKLVLFYLHERAWCLVPFWQEKGASSSTR